MDNLVTLDPVTAFFAKPQEGRPAGSWTNVDAVADRMNFSDWITHVPPFSEKPSRLPTRAADRRTSVETNHEDVKAMMRQSGARGTLDASRKLPTAVLSDKQPINDRMTIRGVGVRK